MNKIRKFLFGGPGYFTGSNPLITSENINESVDRGSRKLAEGFNWGMGKVGEAFSGILASSAVPTSSATGANVYASSPMYTYNLTHTLPAAKEAIEKASPYLSPANYLAAITQGSLNPEVGALVLASDPRLQSLGILGDMFLLKKVSNSVPKAYKNINGYYSNVRKSQKYMDDLENKYNSDVASVYGKYKDKNGEVSEEGRAIIELLYRDYEKQFFGENSDIKGLSYFKNPKASKTNRKYNSEDFDDGNFKTVGDVIRLSTEDFNRVLPGHSVSIVSNGGLSKDSYPLLAKISLRRSLLKKGTIVPVIDNGIYRMVSLNEYGKNPKGMINIDNSIKALRETTKDPNIPDRVTFFGKTYVPAFRFVKSLKQGGLILAQEGLKFPTKEELKNISGEEAWKSITSHPTYKDSSRPLSGADPLLSLAAEYYTGTRGIGAISQWLNSRYLQGLRNRYRETRKYNDDIEQYTGRSKRRENILFADRETRRLGPIYTDDSNPFGFMYNTLVDPLVRGYSDIQKKYPLLNVILP